MFAYLVSMGKIAQKHVETVGMVANVNSGVSVRITQHVISFLESAIATLVTLDLCVNFVRLEFITVFLIRIVITPCERIMAFIPYHTQVVL